MEFSLHVSIRSALINSSRRQLVIASTWHETQKRAASNVPARVDGAGG
jgi:hypothetical protein